MPLLDAFLIASGGSDGAGRNQTIVRNCTLGVPEKKRDFSRTRSSSSKNRAASGSCQTPGWFKRRWAILDPNAPNQTLLSLEKAASRDSLSKSLREALPVAQE
jgi:hypothetical protein